ncbi:NAD-dependent deacetylase, partial [Oceanospirillum sp. HFRX-1_2]
RVEKVSEALDRSDALLVIGSSLMVFSGFRFCRYAEQRGKPVAALTLGKTRADELLQLKLDAPIGPTLGSLIGMLK